MKPSTGKVTYPGQKSVRRVERDGEYEGDVLGLRGEDGDGEDLLITVVEDGEFVYEVPDLETIRERRKIPAATRQLEDPAPYEAEIGPALDGETTELRAELERRFG
jgi:nicotinate phosphoribosyltransferase